MVRAAHRCPFRSMPSSRGNGRTFVKRRLALLSFLAAGAFLGSSASAVEPTAVASPLVAAKSCGRGYVHARLSWGEKCLRAGEFCKVGNREYLRYGFYCPPSRHLRRR